jgi:tetratricopeptide (TPR) repeat protein
VVHFLGVIIASWLELLKAECYYARGEWDRGLAAARIAVERASGLDPKTYAHAMLAMGRMQLNAGDYNEALRTLKVAQDLLTDLDDREGLATAVAEFAAYQLNRGKNEKALALYQEADRIRGRTESRDMTDHSF